jgi:hypothetical protein
LGGGTWTTQKEQLADARPIALICNHTDMGLWQRTDDLILVMWGASEVTQYQALFTSKISQKKKIKSWKLKIEGILEVFNHKKIVKMTRRPYFVVHILFSVSFSAQYKSSICDSAKIFFTSKFGYLLICSLTHKTETGTANRWETIYSKPPGPIRTMGQLETLISSQIIFITLFPRGAQCVCAIYDPQQTLQLCEPKTIFLSQTGIFWLVFIKFYCADHILNTAGDALTWDIWVASQQIVRGFRIVGESGTPQQPVKSTGYMICWRRESNAPYM